MSMELAKQTFSTAPEYLIAGTDIRITTAVKTAAAAVKRGAPVKIDASGSVTVVEAAGSSDAATVSTDGLYGIAADSAEKGEEAVVYLTGEFFADALELESNVTADALEVAFRNIGIFLK